MVETVVGEPVWRIVPPFVEGVNYHCCHTSGDVEGKEIEVSEFVCAAADEWTTQRELTIIYKPD